MQHINKQIYLEPTIILFTKNFKMWMIQLDILEIVVILQLEGKSHSITCKW